MTATLCKEGNCELVFVYGTLRRGFRLHYHLLRLGARFQSEGRVAGELFDFGPYPGARPTTARGRWVRGEIFKLRRPEHDLHVLDQVEGFRPGVPHTCEYVRGWTNVTLAGSSPVRAWIYWWRERATSGRRIISGDYAQWRTAESLK